MPERAVAALTPGPQIPILGYCRSVKPTAGDCH
eukprot:CAMPEP_0173126604 /NCGR_PEP_ID=MMETSP1102-20130122/57240_1 /TAXON_ID=49646 /ORGANISM="Geminigera sp., Strain Caron Lab Isolate" /LENGTH=32 /DNA_ID= /DNA_START= /DNA_END= /DNA_ORIENTATION=